MTLLYDLARVLPANGKWKFESQREHWLHAVTLALDMEMDSRKQAMQRLRFAKAVEAAQITDIGPCGIVIQSNGNEMI